MTPTKFEFNLSSGSQDSGGDGEEPHNGEYLKDFLDGNEEISKTETFLTVSGDGYASKTEAEAFLTACVSRATSPPEPGETSDQKVPESTLQYFLLHIFYSFENIIHIFKNHNFKNFHNC